MEYRMLKVIAGETGLKAGELARDRIRGLFLAGGPQPLDETSRREMEALTGYDLSAARIHSSFPAGSLARSIGAEAFTIGRHIFAPPGRLDPTFSAGRGLLAHELTHVIQQTSPQRTAGGGHETDSLTDETRAAQPLVQAAGGVQGTANVISAKQSRMEAAAEIHEAAARRPVSRPARRPSRRRTQQPEIDKDLLADMVYRLIQNELTVHTDRRR